MKIEKYKNIFCLHLLLTVICYGQNQNIQFDHLTMDDGLSNNSCFSTIQDSDGFIWIGSQEGILRYDDFTLKKYQTILFDSTSLSANWFRTIAEDKYGNLCVAAFGGGLDQYTHIEEKLTTEPNLTNLKIISRLYKSKEFVSDSSINIADNWSVMCGYWDFCGKVIKAIGFIGYNKAYYNQVVYINFIYEVKICKITEDGTFGLLFRYNERKDEGYVLYFWPHGGCSFNIIKGGQTRVRRIEINQPMHQIIGTNVWNTVKIIAHGSKFEIYLNGYLLDTIKDTQYTSGRIGLYLGGDPLQKAMFEITTIKVP